VNWFDGEAVLRHQGFVLPSELQWEYGCRGGTKTLWWTGDDAKDLSEQENAGRERGKRLPVGSMTANPFGLFDMSGNLWEWCLDAYSGYGTEQAGDGRRPEPNVGSSIRCLRGGGFGIDPDYAQSGNRSGYSPTIRSGILGLRAARTSSR